MVNFQDLDIEEGQIGGTFSPTSTTWQNLSRSALRHVRDSFLSWLMRSANKGNNSRKGASRVSARQIEDNPLGYPRFSALIASHDHLFFCRRFSELRARTLLLKQDILSDLERQLQHIDQQETDILRLGCRRADDCIERKSILQKIDDALADYDNLIIRNRQILGFEAARPQAVLSLQNWMSGTRCIARAEHAYLAYSHDLLSIVPTDDTIITWLETLVEKSLIQFRRYFTMHRYFRLSRDPKVHVLSRASTTRIVRILMTPLVVAVLLTPVIICSYLHTLKTRLVTITTAASIFIAVLSGSTNAKTTELVVAGATYTTVLMVFISSNDVPK